MQFLFIFLLWTVGKFATIDCQGLELSQPTTVNGDPYELRDCNSEFDTELKRIYGGEDAQPLEFPHQASLQIRYLNSHVCGATLITNQWLLCAAHCFTRNNYPYSWQIKLGEHNLYEHDLTERLYKVDKIIIHEKYDRHEQLHDIALIRLEKPINFIQERHLSPICLAKWNDIPKKNYVCVVTGWGRSKNGHIVTDVLQKLPQPIHNYQSCKKIWKDVGWPITRHHICVGDLKGGKGVCNGDSGGPIQCRLKNGEWVQFGIASWTISDC
ncbi:Group 3 mite allergen-like protein (serine protease), partial [Euroglyphus maynei]